MMTKQDLANAKRLITHGQRPKDIGEGAQKAFDMHDEIIGRNTGDLYIEKAQRAMPAHDNWIRSAQGASKVMNKDYDQFSPK
jgi:hypothetical protein